MPIVGLGYRLGVALALAAMACDAATQPVSSIEPPTPGQAHPANHAQLVSKAVPARSPPAPVGEGREPAAPAPPPPLTRGYADLDPGNDQVVGPPAPRPECEAELDAAGVRHSPARIGLGRKRDGVYTCGAHQVVRYRSGPGAIAWKRSPVVSCPLGLALADFETIVQHEARALLGSAIASIETLGTYNCRKMAAYDLVSEHSFANAIDIRSFVLENGTTVDVLADFDPKSESGSDAKAKFLRAITHRLYDENVFSVVITPFFDRLHRNHLHLDLARYRVDGSRP